jgi:hypothetical protein
MTAYYRLLLASIAVLWPASAGPARAQDADREERRAAAQESVAEAERLYDSSHYQEALDKLTSTFRLYPSPKRGVWKGLRIRRG